MPGTKLGVCSVASGLIMLLLTYWWLSMAYTFGDEAFVIKWSLLTKKSLLFVDPKPDPETILFVDISGNKTTLPVENEFGEVSDLHREIIVDRSQLAAFFRLMAPFKDEISFIICDVLFDEKTPVDSLLTASMSPFKDKLLAVSHLSEGVELIKPVLDVPYSMATYKTTLGLFLKYPLLLDDKFETLPLKWFQMKDQATYRQKGRFHFIDGHLSLPAPVIDFKVRSTDFGESNDLRERKFTVFPMGTLLELSEMMDVEDLGNTFAGKTVMIGDFENDLHQTPFGRVSGTVILLNAYLSLKNGENLVTWAWVLFLFTGYCLMSLRIFLDVRVKKPSWLKFVFQSRLGDIILNSLDEFFFLIILTFLSYLIFNKHINILILFVYLKVLEFGWKSILKMIGKEGLSNK